MLRYSFIRCKMLMKIGLTLVLFAAVGLYYVAERNDGNVELFGWKLDLDVLGYSKIPEDAKVIRSHPADEKINQVKAPKNKVDNADSGGENVQDKQNKEGIDQSQRKQDQAHTEKVTKATGGAGEVKVEVKVEDVNRQQKKTKAAPLKPAEADSAKASGIKKPAEAGQEAVVKATDQESVRQTAADTGKTDQLAPRGDDDIHLAVVACGDRLEEPLVMIKSALLFSRAKLHVHIFADDDLQPKFKERLDRMPANVQKKFQYHIHNIEFPEGQKPDEWRMVFKMCASQRLFIPDLLTGVRRVLYVDTDILFLRPIDDIWAFFKDFNSTHLAALAWEHEDGSAGWYNRFARHPYYPPFGLNSGVMLMDLPMMREADWTGLMKEYFREYKYRITWGDQDLINIFFHHFPEKLYVFQCDYNYRPDHCMYMQNCKPAGNVGVSIVHGCRGVYHNEKQMTFRAIYDAFKEYPYDEPMDTHLVDAIHDNIGDISSKIKDRCIPHQDIFTKQLRQTIKDVGNR